MTSNHKPFHYQYMFSPDKNDPSKIEMLNDYIELYDKDGNKIKLEKVKIMPIDDKNANSQLMKYNSFDEWFVSTDLDKLVQLKVSFAEMTKEFMHRAWNAALDSNTPKRGSSKTIMIQNISIGGKIIELLTTINSAEKIDCTCDQIQIASGYRCACGRGIALQYAGKELGNYLKKLRKGLK